MNKLFNHILHLRITNNPFKKKLNLLNKIQNKRIKNYSLDKNQ